jgi:S1-C subfamily serine protease
MWLEGTCDRPVPERRAGWRFDKKPDATLADRPWVIGAIWPGGAAERAGLMVGDRVLEVGGKPATNDVAPLWALELQPVGTKVPVVVAREGAPKRRVSVTMELRSPPPSLP